jgi:hypothetical protein
MAAFVGAYVRFPPIADIFHSYDLGPWRMLIERPKEHGR